MATITSQGIGSGLDVKSIVSQLVALERQPLTQLQVQAATVQTRISTFGQLKSLFSTLSDAAATLGSLTTYNTVKANSSDTKSVSATAIGGTAAGSFSVEVDTLAKAQATASAALLPVGGALGAGTLRLQLGRWTVVPASFLPQAGVAPVDITVSASDTVNDLASKINSANAGVRATVLNDSSGQRLLLRSSTTGEAAGFELSVLSDDDGNPADALGLSRVVVGQSIDYAQNAAVRINGIPVTSSSNTFTDVVSGITLKASAVTTSPVEVTVEPDGGPARAAIDKFVAAYNAINQQINELTKFDPATRQGGLLQGDATAIGLQNALRGILQSASTGSAYARLADIGITQQLGGALSVDSTKLSAALANGTEVQKLFRTDNPGAANDGVALKLREFTKGLLAADGFFSSKDSALKRSLELNSKDQARVNAKVARVEAELNRRYNALDVQMSQLNGLNAYVTQQVAQWNKKPS